ncbi:MAG: peptidase, partial [Armatimonadetes bacterium]|nr:peptidase [Armatimonadota bacterium]
MDCWIAPLFRAFLAALTPMRNARRGAPAVVGAAVVMATLTVVAGAAPAPQAARRPRRSAPAYRPDAVMVAYKSDAAPQARLQAAARAGLAAGAARGNAHFAVLKLTPQARASGQTVEKALATLRADPAVRIAEPDFPVRASGIPNDPYFPVLYGLHNIGQSSGTVDADIDAPEAWEVTTGSKNVVVAVIDTGVDYHHPDLDFNILRDESGAVIGYDYYNDDADPMDDNGHGTHVSGTIGARGNNGVGVVGVSQVVRIMPLKFLGSDGGGFESGAVQSIDFAVEHGARILSNSWGGGGGSQLLLEAIQRARMQGVLFVAAAGNDSSDNDQFPTYPAAFSRDVDNVIAVAATDRTDELAWFSNYGPESVDVAAPGEDVLSTTPRNTYSYYSGTSMATPHVSGVAALILGRFPNLPLSALKLRLASSAEPLPSLEGRVRFGRLSATRSLEVDAVPPGTPGSFRAISRGESGILLSWQSPGDDGLTGYAGDMELRYSRQPITPTNFEDAQRAAGVPTPGASGSEHEYLLGGLEADTEYYVALRAADNVGNYSDLALLGPLRTLPAAILELVRDGAEGTPAFLPDAPWSVTTEDAWSGATSYTDSAGGSYANGLNASLTQASSLVVSGGETVLGFHARTDLEYGADILYVETSFDDGATWSALASLTGTTAWTAYRYPLAARGDQVKVRFRLNTDESVTRGGVWLDDLAIFTPMPLCLLQDDVEGTPAFAGDGTWAATHEDSFSPTHSYTDSPGVEYASGGDTSLTQAAGVALGDTLAQLTFRARTNLEPFYDNLLIEVSDDEGLNWEFLDYLSGQSDWTSYSISLARFHRQTVRVRFRLLTDGSVTEDGVWLDDIRICGEVLAPYAAVAPAPPAAVAATATSPTQVSVTWEAGDPSATGYALERREAAGSFLIAAIVPGATRTYADHDLKAGTAYTYRLRSVRDGLYSGYSAESTTTTLPAPAAPAAVSELIASVVNKVNVTLAWKDNSSTEDRFRLERRVGDGAFRVIESLPANTTSYLDPSLAFGTAYSYRVV